jgi:hypothetical protein
VLARRTSGTEDYGALVRAGGGTMGYVTSFGLGRSNDFAAAQEEVEPSVMLPAACLRTARLYGNAAVRARAVSS